MKQSPEIQRFVYFICKAARSIIPSERLRNPRAYFNFCLYASNKLNEVFEFNMSKNSILEQVYAYKQYGILCKNYYEENEWPVEYKQVEYELHNTEMDYETDTTIDNYNNLEYCSMPDSSEYHSEIEDEIREYDLNEVTIRHDVDAEVRISSIASGVLLPEDDKLVIYANKMCDENSTDEDRDEFTQPYSLRKLCEDYLKKTILVSYDSLDDFGAMFDENHIKFANEFYSDEQNELKKSKEQEAVNAKDE